MNRLRFRSGQVQLRRAPVASGTVIEAGDLVWLDAGEAKPAADFVWTTNLATTQAAFAAKFLGIAHQPSADGETAPISVDVSPDSVYEMDCNSAAYPLGQSLGCDASGSNLMNQQLEAAVATASIARAAEFAPSSTTALRVTFASALHTSSSNVNSQLG